MNANITGRKRINDGPKAATKAEYASCGREPASSCSRTSEWQRCSWCPECRSTHNAFWGSPRGEHRLPGRRNSSVDASDAIGSRVCNWCERNQCQVDWTGHWRYCAVMDWILPVWITSITSHSSTLASKCEWCFLLSADRWLTIIDCRYSSLPLPQTHRTLQEILNGRWFRRGFLFMDTWWLTVMDCRYSSLPLPQTQTLARNCGWFLAL